MPSMTPAYRVARRREGMDPNTRRLALFAGVIGGALLLLVGAWSLTGPRHTGVPVVEADSRPVREKPKQAGGMTVDGQDDAILSGESDGKAALAPPPETPALQALKAQEQAGAQPAPAPAAAAPAASVRAVPEPPAPAAPAVEAPPKPIARPTTAPAATEPKPAAKVAAASVPVPPPAKPAPAAAAGGPLVQLAALTTEAGASVEWQRLSKKMPELFNGRRPSVVRTEHDGKIFWRLRTGGFADTAQATAFCKEVRAKGAGCSIVLR
jgi:hypothetical protein